MEQNVESPARGRFGRGLEWALVLIGAFLNIVIVVLFAVGQAGTLGGTALQNLYPFPLLYFIEILGLSFLAILPLTRTEPAGNRRGWNPVLLWISAGGLLAFVILGGFSIGFFLIPGTLAFIAAGILADRRQNRSIAGHVAVLFLAAAVQVAIMLVAVAELMS